MTNLYVTNNSSTVASLDSVNNMSNFNATSITNCLISNVTIAGTNNASTTYGIYENA